MNHHCLISIAALLLPLAASAKRPAPHAQLAANLEGEVQQLQDSPLGFGS
jgi:hypothetical protein